MGEDQPRRPAVRANPWFEYVHSEANIADLPSRGEYGYLEQQLKSELVLPMRLPSLAGWEEQGAGATRSSGPRKRRR